MDEHPSVAHGAEILQTVRDTAMRGLVRYRMRVRPGGGSFRPGAASIPPRCGRCRAASA